MAQETRRIPPAMVVVVVVLVLVVRACRSQLHRQPPPKEVPARRRSSDPKAGKGNGTGFQVGTQGVPAAGRTASPVGVAWPSVTYLPYLCVIRKLSLQRNYLCVAQLCSNKLTSKILKYLVVSHRINKGNKNKYKGSVGSTV